MKLFRVATRFSRPTDTDIFMRSTITAHAWTFRRNIFLDASRKRVKLGATIDRTVQRNYRPA